MLSQEQSAHQTLWCHNKWLSWLQNSRKGLGLWLLGSNFSCSLNWFWVLKDIFSNLQMSMTWRMMKVFQDSRWIYPVCIPPPWIQSSCAMVSKLSEFKFTLYTQPMSVDISRSIKCLSCEWYLHILILGCARWTIAVSVMGCGVRRVTLGIREGYI